MKQIFSIALLIVCSYIFTQKSIAQTTLKEGTITYSVSADMPDHPEVASMFAGSTSIISFKPGHVASVLNIATTKTQSIIDATANSGVILMDAMGNKMMIKMNGDQMKQRQVDAKSYDVKTTDETKQIAGYTCKKSIVKTDNGTELTYWVTNDIAPPSSDWQKYAKVSGFPLEYQLARKGMVMTFTATSVNADPVKDEVFSYSPDGYTEMNFDDFMKMAGGN